jgi:excisionase family DNA binding protein
MESSGLAALLEQPLINRDALAERLAVSADTIETWTAKKKIPAFRLGHRTVRYSYPAVIAALGKFYAPQRSGWSRRLPKRRRRYERPVRLIQLELELGFDQMTLLLDESFPRPEEKS